MRRSIRRRIMGASCAQGCLGSIRHATGRGRQSHGADARVHIRREDQRALQSHATALVGEEPGTPGQVAQAIPWTRD
jgi:hypothetical protein